MLVFEAVMLVGQGEVLSHTIVALVKTVGVGLSIGVVAGWITTQLMRREWLPFELHKFGILALVLISFSVSNHLSHFIFHGYPCFAIHLINVRVYMFSDRDKNFFC